MIPSTTLKSVAVAVLEELIAFGVSHYCIAPGGRNAALIALLKHEKDLTKFYFNDERSAAFFALGCCRRIDRPVAVIVTSGTAVGNLLPAAMEAYYTAVPLVLLTADRPRRFRGSNAPQACEQLAIFGQYAPCQIDIAEGETLSLAGWDRRGPLHLNICLEEPKDALLAKEATLNRSVNIFLDPPVDKQYLAKARQLLENFLKKSSYPFVIVSTLRCEAHEAVAQYLQKLGAPLYVEGISGLREDPRLQPLCIEDGDTIAKTAFSADYPIDAILRIGAVPTLRFWRDLEELNGQIPVLSINENPFAGLSWGGVVCYSLMNFFLNYKPDSSYAKERFTGWKSLNRRIKEKLENLYRQEPRAEPSLIHHLSQIIPETASIFLGQSLPIRTWDLAACYKKRHTHVYASRGLNGIDGQLSTFLGLADAAVENWAILGDLTALHDLGGWWIVSQMPEISIKVVIINNGGGKIFSRMFSDKEIQNLHRLNFKNLAAFWGIPYVRWETIPSEAPAAKQLLIEVCPDDDSTVRFWKEYL